MSSFASENIHQGQERINDESRGRKENFCRFANGGVKISIKFFSTEVGFFAVHPAVLKYQAKVVLLVFFYILPTTACCFGRMFRKNVG